MWAGRRVSRSLQAFLVSRSSYLVFRASAGGWPLSYLELRSSKNLEVSFHRRTSDERETRYEALRKVCVKLVQHPVRESEPGGLETFRVRDNPSDVFGVVLPIVRYLDVR